MRRTLILLALHLAASAACSLRSPEAYLAVPARPEYLLRSPDSTETPYSSVPDRYSRTGPGWIDMRHGLGLRVEVAYFRDPDAERDVKNYLGLETVRYEATPDGRLAQAGAATVLDGRPQQQLAADRILSEAQRNLAHHRFFYQFLFTPTDLGRRAVLLSAETAEGLSALEKQLRTDPEALRCSISESCTVFPESSSASLEMEIFVNGSRQMIPWRTRLSRVVEDKPRVRLYRDYRGRRARVRLPRDDRKALALPLLPGDEIEW